MPNKRKLALTPEERETIQKFARAGGLESAARLTRAQRSAKARKAAVTRWAKKPALEVLPA